MTGKCIFACAAFALLSLPSQAARGEPWTKEKAWRWYNAQPWMRGCNYMPASCANRIDQWQEEGSDERFKEMERELDLAKSIGFNTLRIIVGPHGYSVWRSQHDGFMERFEKYLSMMSERGMRAVVVLALDGMFPLMEGKLVPTGPQSYALGYHGGRRPHRPGLSPKKKAPPPGKDVTDDFFAMCREIMTKYRSDGRIVFWNLWNEPGNLKRDGTNARYLERLFALAWEIDPVHPLAADVWDGDYGTEEKTDNSPQRLAGRLSDIVSYHCYGDYEEQVRIIRLLRRHYGRPLLNTEWLARIKRNDVFSAYPLYYIENIACMCWGFVAGKYQTYEPWEVMWQDLEKGTEESKSWDITKWFHDLYRPSLRPYDPKEIELIKRFNAYADSDRAGKKK